MIKVTIRDGKTFANIEDLKLWDKNPRSIQESGFKRLKKQLIKLGQYKPIIVDVDGITYGGNMRLRAMRELVNTKHGKRFREVWVSVVKPEHKDHMMEIALSDNDRAGFMDVDMFANLIPNYEIDFSMFSGDFSKPVALDTLIEGMLDDAGNKEVDTETKRVLRDEFLIPPFSLFDARQGYWQDRKRLWKNIIKDRGETREATLGMGTLVDNPNYKTGNLTTVSILDPVLAETLIRWFCPIGGRTFDPFAGDSVFGYVSGFLGRPFTGIELRAEQCNVNQTRANLAKFDVDVKYICDDGQNVATHMEPESQDFLFSCPPYFDLEVYSSDPRDASNQESYADFISIIDNAVKGAATLLKPDRFAAFVVSDVRAKRGGGYWGFPDDVKRIFRENGFMIYNEIVFINAVGTAALRAARYFKHRKVARVHQDIILAYKGDPKLAKFHEDIIIAYKGNVKGIERNFDSLGVLDLTDSIEKFQGDYNYEAENK